jgi:lipopolysaccharide/colanic/teichoic acid biosynthesis glycosyltransferase
VARRCFDILVSGLGLIVLSPLLLAFALIVVMDSRGPSLFRQPRLGKDAHIFTLYKFRTMVADSGSAPAITLHRDARVTRAGRWLRRFDLDELPTLFNVLIGDMSIVGPRPETPDFLSSYTDEQRRVFSVRPGLTDPATLRFRDEAKRLLGPDAERVYRTEILPHKLAVSLDYLARRNFASDLRVVLETVWAVLLRPKG